MSIDVHTAAEWDALLAEAAKPRKEIRAQISAAHKADAASAPASAYAHYRTLSGDARFKFYVQNAHAVWAGYHASLAR